MKYCRFFVAFCLACSFLIPDRVRAENQTYVLPPTSRELLGTYGNDSIDWYGQINNGGSRLTFLGSENSGRLYIVSMSRGDLTRFYLRDTSLGPQANTAKTVNGITYFVGYIYQGQGNVYNQACHVFYQRFGSADSTVSDENAIYYTFGAGAVEPAPPPPDYGDLLDVKFSTSIAGSGSAAINNIDHITWNPEMDSNGIEFDDTARVQIKAIAGNYTDSSRNGLLGLGVTDFDYNSGSEHMLAEYPATRGYYDVSWSHVIQQLNAGSISDFLNIRKNDDVWLKSGWIYQIRLVVGEYEGQWITIYNATSSGVENSLTIENSTELNMTLVNTIQQINNLNQSVTNWQIDNTTINMENQDGTETTDKPWWAYLLEALVSLLNGILGFLGNLIGDLIDAIVSLFQPDEFTINNFNEYKLELKQNSGIFGQAIDFTTTLKNTFLGVQYQDPVLHWSGISFGETVFIPAADYNLNDYVTMWGLGDFRTMAYLCSDGFIYFSLLVLIVRKLNEVLKK